MIIRVAALDAVAAEIVAAAKTSGIGTTRLAVAAAAGATRVGLLRRIGAATDALAVAIDATTLISGRGATVEAVLAAPPGTVSRNVGAGAEAVADAGGVATVLDEATVGAVAVALAAVTETDSR